MNAPTRILQGPQRPRRRIGEAVADARLPDGPLAVVSAGWQEAEGDLDELAQLVGRPLLDLELYGRAEQIFEADPALRRAYRTRQDRLMQVQALYRARLQSLAEAARRISTADAPPELLAPEIRHAFAQLRALDRHHLGRTEEIHAEFRAAFSVATHPALAAVRGELEARLASATGVILTGGNVLVLLNRLQLFDVAPLLRERPVIAWSAGAMVLAERVVLYHDRSPGRRREAEILGVGAGLLPGWVFLPDGRRRLQVDDSTLLQLLSRRFAPRTCVVLDNGTSLRFAGDRLEGAHGARRLTRSGAIREFETG